jgi:hypothetical protein
MSNYNIEREQCKWCCITVGLLAISSFCFAMWLCLEEQSMWPMVIWMVVAVVFAWLADGEEFDPWDEDYDSADDTEQYDLMP